MITELLRSAFELVPESLRTIVTLIDVDGNKTCGTAIVVPESLGASGLNPGSTVIAERIRVALLAEGLAFAPQSGMILRHGDTKYVITSRGILNPSGTQPTLYRFLAER